MSKPGTGVSDYLESLGLKEFRTTEKFWSFMERKHGESTCAELDAAFESLSQGDLDSFYSSFYRDLDVSLGLASLRINLYREFIRWFTDSFPTIDGSVLDIGCGNGILTCFLAQKYSLTRVVGIDKCAEAISCARALAARLQLKNVEFIVADCSRLDVIPEATFDVVLSMTGLDAASQNLFDNDDNLLDWAIKVGEDICNRAMIGIGKHLKPSGMFVSADRLPNCKTQFAWSLAIQNVGLGIDLEKTTEFSFSDAGTKETLPIIVASAVTPKVGDIELLSFWVETHGGFDRLCIGDSNEALCELYFSAINPKQLVRGWNATYLDGSGVTSYEIWQSGVFVLLYTHSTSGTRSLKIAPAYTLAATLRSMQRQVDSLREGVSIASYS